MVGWGWLIIAFLVGLLLREFLPSYLREKGKNIATKEDVGEITRIAEEIKTENQLLLEKTKPLTAEEILRRQSSFSSKLDAFNEALEVVYRKFSSESMNIHTDTESTLPPASAAPPTEVELNRAYGRLAFVASNKAILDKYVEIYQTKSSPSHVGELVGLMRQDLGFGEPIVSGDLYAYIFGRERKKTTVADA